MKGTFFFFFLIILSTYCFSQTDTIDNNTYIQSLIEDASLENNENQLVDIFEELSQNPININHASINELLKIPFMNYPSAQEIIKLKNQKGKINSIEDLRTLENLDDNFINKISPFIKFDEMPYLPKFTLKNIFSDLKLYHRTRILYNIQKERGFSENKFTGTRGKLYNRININSNKYFSTCILFEKDNGEKSLLDFYSFNLQLKNFSHFSDITLGDYNIEFGQGLVLWSPYSFSKGVDAVNLISRNSKIIRTYSGTNENNFLRGLSFNLSIKNLTITPFISFNLLDASIDSNTNKINSLLTDGYHRTKTELKKKNIVSEKILGMVSYYEINKLNKVGLLYYNNQFNHEFENNLTYSKNSFDYFSFCYSSVIRKIYLSGEFAYYNSLVASINNLSFEVSKNLSLLFSLRIYPPNFWSLHGNPFGEKSVTQNETGFYSGIYIKTTFGNFNFYYDQFKFPKGTSNSYLPAKGEEFLIFYYHKIFKNTELRIKYKKEKKEQETVVNNINVLYPRTIENIRLEIQNNLTNKLKLKTRIEYISTKFYQQNEKGLMIFEDINYNPIKTLKIFTRVIFFKTDSYYSRIYQYENDLPGLVTIPFVYGEGMRWYILFKYQTNFGLILSIKYSELFKPTEKIIGSGYNEIKGNLNNDISFQVDYQL
ncbi:MAG: helix-hairpin-helix domain-containing protein [Melioribacter sp.]|nr:helix-hairpin-helix domain-containing protein [Melioribacter sp.]